MKLKVAGKQQFLLICLLMLPLCSDCDKVRLWPSKCSGRVEVFHNDRWGTVCDDGWESGNSKVLCQELGCGHVLRTRHGTNPGLDPIWLAGLKCYGNESSIFSCQHNPFGHHNCDHPDDAVIDCSEGVRLSNGTDRCSGVVEVYGVRDWGAVCNSNWNQNLSAAVCQQLQCGSDKKTEATKGQYMGYITSCAENQNVSDCGRTNSNEMCHGVELYCEGIKEIRLVNGSDRCSGRVEVFHNSRWGTVCDHDWDMRDAKVVCRAVDCGAPLKATHSAAHGKGRGTIWLDYVECEGDESDLIQCRHNPWGDNYNCGHSNDAGVVCASLIRLVNGTTDCSGTVEFAPHGQWASVRKTPQWGIKEASTVCREMNCGGVWSFSGSNSSNEPRKMYDVTCSGQESSLSYCTLKEYNRTQSGDQTEDATVTCTVSFQKPKVLMSPSSTVNWGERLDITCVITGQRTRGYFTLKKTNDTFQMEKTSEGEAATFTFQKVNFSQDGSYFCEYKKPESRGFAYYPQGEALRLTVTVALEKPGISISSYSLNGVSVTRGQSFSLHCSVHSIYPGGFFYLTKSKVKASKAKLAVNSSYSYGLEVAEFEFLSAEDSHKGEYSCVYGVNMSSRSFTSEPSEVIQVSVVDKSSSVVAAVVITLFVLGGPLILGYLIWSKRKSDSNNSVNGVQFANRK